MKLSYSQKLRIFHIFNHIGLIISFFAFEPLLFAISIFLWFLFGGIGISIGFHRYLSHRAFETYKWFEKLSLFLGCLATGGSPLGWAGIHRLHHMYSDTEQDPHSPHHIGFLKTYFHLWSVKRIPKRITKDLLKNRTVMFLHNNYFKILISYILILFVINPIFVIYFYCIPSVIAFHVYGMINTLGHSSGYRNFNTKDKSTNNIFVNILSHGEGYHNNHHKSPTSISTSTNKKEIDISFLFLKTFRLIK